MTLSRIPHPKPKRLPRRFAVTVVVGFRCSDGIVVCSDTQETLKETKTNVPKLIVRTNVKPPSIDTGEDLMVAFAGAGDGAFVDKVVSTAWEDVQMATNIDGVCEEIERSIKNTHREYGEIFQTGYLPDADIIYGVKMHGKSRLFASQGPIVNEKATYVANGRGYYLANFVASRMHSEWISVNQAIILATYLLFQAKEHVDGCGGDSHIAALRDSGGSGQVEWQTVSGLNAHIKQLDFFLDKPLLITGDLTKTSEEIETALDAFKAVFKLSRKHYEDAARVLEASKKILSNFNTPPAPHK